MPTAEKLACVTLDFEMDYGWRTRQFNILHHHQPDLATLQTLLARVGVPISAFIVTSLLETWPQTIDLVQNLAQDLHGHSHTHNMDQFDSEAEISQMVATFRAVFGAPPLGYRAPLGVLRPNEIDLLAQAGLKFSSSIFPTIRPGLFNHMGADTHPFFYDNGLLELPLAVLRGPRLILSLSYLKLLGWRVYQGLISAFGLPDVVIFNTHLHDFIWDAESFSQLPRPYQLAWGRNRHQGMAYFGQAIDLLRHKGYHFITMTELYQRERAARTA